MKEFNEVTDETNTKTELLFEQFNSSTGSIEELNGILNELDDGNLTAKSIGLILEKYDEFLPYLNDEVVLREMIAEKINENTDLAIDALAEQLMANEDFFNILVDGNNQL